MKAVNRIGNLNGKTQTNGSTKEAEATVTIKMPKRLFELTKIIAREKNGGDVQACILGAVTCVLASDYEALVSDSRKLCAEIDEFNDQFNSGEPFACLQADEPIDFVIPTTEHTQAKRRAKELGLDIHTYYKTLLQRDVAAARS